MDEPPELSDEVRALLAGPVDSVEKIETLFLAWREPEVAWSVSSAAARLRLPADAVAGALDELAAGKLLVADGNGYRYAPRSTEMARSAAALCKVYDGDRLLVLREMTTLAMERIRSSAARAFSDAFRFRKRGPGGDNDA